MAYVPQENGVFPGLTVDEHLRLARHFNSDCRQRQDELLGLFPTLRERLSQNAQTLSGGERKMLGFVMALSSSPSVVLMDEPTEGVAPVIREQLVDALKKISDEVSVLIVEQNLDTALAIANRGHVMERGRIVASGGIRAMHESGQLEKLLAV
jgi:branched-chain amino acid transport system ATP-binding protein